MFKHIKRQFIDEMRMVVFSLDSLHPANVFVSQQHLVHHRWSKAFDMPLW